MCSVSFGGLKHRDVNSEKIWFVWDDKLKCPQKVALPSQLLLNTLNRNSWLHKFRDETLVKAKSEDLPRAWYTQWHTSTTALVNEAMENTMQILNGTLIEGLKDGARMNVGVNAPVYLPLCPGSTTQGAGGSFKKGNLYERLVVVMHGCRANPLMDLTVVGAIG